MTRPPRPADLAAQIAAVDRRARALEDQIARIAAAVESLAFHARRAAGQRQQPARDPGST